MILWKNRCLFKIAALASLCAATLHGQTQPKQEDALRSGFENPPAAARLRCYWWWLKGNTTAETITRDLEGMKAKGFAGAILVDADGSGQAGNQETGIGPAIGSPQWIALFVHALAVAQRLGLDLSLNITSRWDVGIIGGPTVSPEDAMKKLTWSRTTVSGGGQRTVQLAAPRTENGFYRPVAILAYPLRHGAPLPGSQQSDRAPILDLVFKRASKETGFSMPPSSQVLRDEPSVAGEEDAGISDVVDLTSRMDENGILDWTFPPGMWEVLRIGYTDTAKHLIDDAGTPVGLPLDAMSASAFDDYWREVVMPLLQAAKPYIGTSLRYLVTDSWEAGGTNWSSDFREQFKRRRGYDPVAYLPIMTGRILDGRETSNRFLFDLRRTVADLIAENYYDHFAQRAREQGLGTHPEAGGPHGAPIDALENFRSTSFPQTEFWVVSGTHRATDDERFFVKQASSAAHIYGKPFVAAEGPTSMNPAAWSESLGGDLQPAFDYALTEGLNRLYWHEFTSSPAEYGMPGQEYFAGTHLNPNVTWWDQASPFLLALNRAQFLMQQGKPVSDVLYFYGEQVPGFARLRNDDPARALPGYDYDVVNEDALLHRIEYGGPDLHTPEGVHYRALSLPASRTLSYPVLEWLQHFVLQGGIVVGSKPTGPLGLLSSDQRAEYIRITDAMWSGCKGGATSSHYGHGQIYCTANARDALGAMGVASDFSYRLNDQNASQSEPAFEYVHRKTGDAEIYFVRNTRPQEERAVLSFRVHDRAPELWVPDDGTTLPALAYRETNDNRTEIPLTFPPMGSVFVVFSQPAARHLVSIEKNGDGVFPSIRQGAGVFSSDQQELVTTTAGTYRTTDSQGSKQTFIVRAADLQAPTFAEWTLSFPSGWGAPQSIPLHRFQSWTECADPGIRYFSGTATYRTTFHISADSLATGRQLWLELHQVREIATVTVNGRKVETVWRQPFTARVDQFLHAGDNRIEINVTNLWPNRLIGDLQPSAIEKFTHTNVHSYTKDSQLLPSGILEPVTLEVGSRLPQK
jgi:(4-O-methyl)-D-glucuronate---lignin esterase